jgi:outer membrane protein OmpA-like peptidoglycan-associated protein
MPPPPPPPPPPPVDSDGDGVPDNLDKCPGTPPGFKVDADGCIIMQTIVLHAVNFKTNSDQLTDADKQSIDTATAPLLTAMRAQASLHLEVDGHTDSRGSAAYNLKLSDRRATSVKNYLVSKGFDFTHLTSHGYGATKPIASNDTDDGRAQNRRVEFVITGAAAADTKIVTEGSTAAAQSSAEDQSKPKATKKKTK